MPRPAAKKKVVRRVVRRAPAVVPRVSGRGAYTYDKPGPWGRIGRAVGRQAGGMIGSQYGVGKAAAQAGDKLGSYLHYIGKIFGSGDYVTASAGVKANNLVGAGAQAPQFAGSNIVRIRHREFLGDVYTSATPGAFQIQRFPINPGLTATFPWLAAVCGATFQQYRLNGMVFEYRSMSANALNSTNTALGSVAMCTDYDSADVAFTSKQQMENTMFGVSCKPSSNMIHAIECAKFQTAVEALYVRAFGIPANTDPRLYDMGNFYIATVGMQAASVNIGELWVSYDVSLMKTIDQVPMYIAPFAYYTLPTAGPGNGYLGLPNTQVKVADQIGLTVSVSTVTWPATIEVGSIWEIYYNLLGSVTGSVGTTTTTVSGGMISLTQDISVPDSVPASSAKVQYHNKYKYVGGGTVAAPPTVVFTPLSTFPTSITAANIKVFQVSGTFASTPALSELPPVIMYDESELIETERSMGYMRVHEPTEKKTTLLRTPR